MGINALCDALRGNNTLTSLKYASHLETLHSNALTASNHVLNHSCVRSVASNGIAGEGANVLANAVLEHASMTDFCGIPLASLRDNSVTELNLEGTAHVPHLVRRMHSFIGIPGSIVLSKLIPSATALTSLKCVSHPAQA